jgi:hypothetical protein
MYARILASVDVRIDRALRRTYIRSGGVFPAKYVQNREALCGEDGAKQKHREQRAEKRDRAGEGKKERREEGAKASQEEGEEAICRRERGRNQKRSYRRREIRRRGRRGAARSIDPSIARSPCSATSTTQT